jgi:hypothetical protein
MNINFVMGPETKKNVLVRASSNLLDWTERSVGD